MKQVSSSAHGVAYLRYLEEEISKDTLARYFAQGQGREVAEAWLKIYPQVARQVALRGRYIEDIAIQHINKGFRQVMNIAAGLNSFPYRAAEVTKLVRYAELDYPDMLIHKKALINDLVEKSVILCLPPNVMYVPLDLTKNKLDQVFSKLLWDWKLPTLFIIEGLSYYLPFNVLKRILDAVSAYAPPRSVVVMDYFPARVKTTGVFQKIMSSIKKNGEPCYTCPTPTDVKVLFENFTIISDRNLPDIEKDYCADCFTIDFDAIIIAETHNRSRSKFNPLHL